MLTSKCYAGVLMAAGAVVAALGIADMVSASDAAGNCRMHRIGGSNRGALAGTHCELSCVVGTCKFVKGPQARFRSPPLWTCGCANAVVDVTAACDGTVTADGDPNTDPGSINTTSCNGTCPNKGEHCDTVDRIMSEPGPGGWTSESRCGCVKGKKG